MSRCARCWLTLRESAPIGWRRPTTALASPSRSRVSPSPSLDSLAARIAGGLIKLGIGRGDGVAVMLPNSSRFAATIYAIFELGAVYTGIPPAYGARDTHAILRRSRARAVVVPRAFRSGEQQAMIRTLRAGLPDLRHVIVVDPKELDDGELPFRALEESEPVEEPANSQPGDVCHIGFTSGTTGEPKGVMNTHQTLDAVMRRFVEHIGRESFGEPGVLLVASPVGHHTGFLWGVLLGAALRMSSVYVDRWEPRAVVGVMREERVSVMFGAPTFLQDLVSAVDDALPGFRTAVVAGAPVPRGLQAEARQRLGCWVCPAWGMTEWGIGVSWHPGLGDAAHGTDGVPVASCEVRVVGR